MNQGRSPPVPPARQLLTVMAALVLPGCLGPPDIDAARDPLVVTETGSGSAPVEQSPERAAALLEMRAKAEAGESMPYPDAFQRGQTVRLAARPEPRPVSETTATEAELAAIATRRAAAVSPVEIAALDRRAAELRRLLATAGSGGLRR